MDPSQPALPTRDGSDAQTLLPWPTGAALPGALLYAISNAYRTDTWVALARLAHPHPIRPHTLALDAGGTTVYAISQSSPTLAVCGAVPAAQQPCMPRT